MGLALSCVLAGFALCLHADNLLLGAYALEGAADLFIHSFLVGVVALCVVVFVSAHDGEKRRWSIGVGLSHRSRAYCARCSTRFCLLR